MTRHSEKSGHPSWASSLDNLSDSIPSPDRLQHSVIFYCSVMVLVTMSATIASLASFGQYTVDIGTLIDVFTLLAVASAATLAFMRQRMLLQGFLLCVSVPVNLLAMLVMDNQGIFEGMLLLSITPIIWGLFTTMWMSFSTQLSWLDSSIGIWGLPVVLNWS